MFRSQERAIMGLKPGEVSKLLKFCPVKAGRKEVLKPVWSQVALSL